MSVLWGFSLGFGYSESYNLVVVLVEAVGYILQTRLEL